MLVYSCKIYTSLLLLITVNVVDGLPERKNVAYEDNADSVLSANPADLIAPFFQKGGLLETASKQADFLTKQGTKGALLLNQLRNAVAQQLILQPQGDASAQQSGVNLDNLGDIAQPVADHINLSPAQTTALRQTIADVGVLGKFMFELLHEKGGLQQFFDIINDPTARQDLFRNIGSGTQPDR